MIRRDPEGIVTAHQMDPKRRELYVEGSGDQAFFYWLTSNLEASNAVVRPISTVDMPDIGEGGERARLLEFLHLLEEHQLDSLRGFVDADQDRFLNLLRDLPNGWFTDHRDLESYVLAVDNIDTGFRAGCSIQAPAAEAIFRAMSHVAVTIAAVRLASVRHSLELPVSSGKWIKQVKATKSGELQVDVGKLVASQLQEASISLHRLEQTLVEVTEARSELEKHPVLDVIHGKDCMRILTKQLAALGAKVGDASYVMRSTFQRDHLPNYESLAAAVAFLCSAA